MKKNDLMTKQILQILPPVELIKIHGEADFYGISSLLAEKIGLPFVPFHIASWKHGWLYADLKYVEQIIGNRRSENNVFVPLKQHQDFLKPRGITATAVGLPFLYVEDFDNLSVVRQKNSLLVMPPHSIPTSSHTWNEEKYAQEINALKSDFDIIVVCLYQSCIEKGLWIKAFEQYDIPWIIGARSDDKNSLIRMNRIFRSFEYMTTNSIGSHIVYASYCGCKVSIYGSYAEYSKDDYKEDALYKKYPFLLQHNLSYASEKTVRSRYPFLFMEPKNAGIMIKWAEKELGKDNKVTPYKLAILLGWLPHTQFFIIGKKICMRIGLFGKYLYSFLIEKDERN